MKELFCIESLSFQNIEYRDICILKNGVNFIVGESGTGKSTLLKLFNQTLSQTSGDIIFEGKSIQEIDTVELRKQVSLISQSVFLFDDTIRANFEKYYEYRGEELIKDEEIKFYLNLCCINFELDKNCTTMSGGERQRIYTAIFLSFKPKVIMLDEPTSALDNKNSLDVIGNVISFCNSNSISVIIVSHDRELTQKFAENIINIEKTVCK